MDEEVDTVLQAIRAAKKKQMAKMRTFKKLLVEVAISYALTRYSFI